MDVTTSIRTLEGTKQHKLIVLCKHKEKVIYAHTLILNSYKEAESVADMATNMILSLSENGEYQTWTQE